MVTIAFGHLPIIIQDATGIDELIVGADKGHYLPAMRFKRIKIAEGVRYVSYVARTGLRHVRIR